MDNRRKKYLTPFVYSTDRYYETAEQIKIENPLKKEEKEPNFIEKQMRIYTNVYNLATMETDSDKKDKHLENMLKPGIISIYMMYESDLLCSDDSQEHYKAYEKEESPKTKSNTQLMMDMLSTLVALRVGMFSTNGTLVTSQGTTIETQITQDFVVTQSLIMFSINGNFNGNADENKEHKEFKNYTAKEIERRYGLPKGGYHKVKDTILRDLKSKNSPYKKLMNKIGNNPDIHLAKDR